MPIRPVNTGTTLRMPPKSSRPRNPPLRFSRSATNRNSAEAVRPWLNICSSTPSSAAAFWMASVVHARGRARRRKHRQQAVAQMVDGRIGEHPLEVALRERGAGGEHDGRHRQPEQRREHLADLVRKNRQQNPQETIDAHLRHDAGQQHRHRAGRFGIGGGQPGMERHHRHFHRKTEERAEENDQADVFPAEGRLQFGGEQATFRHVCQPDEIETTRFCRRLVASQIARKLNSKATLPTIV